MMLAINSYMMSSKININKKIQRKNNYKVLKKIYKSKNIKKLQYLLKIKIYNKIHNNYYKMDYNIKNKINYN